MTEQEWLACTDPKLMLEFLRGKASDRKLRLFAVACCDRIQHISKDPRSRSAVSALRRAADGCAGDEELAREVHHAERARAEAVGAVCVQIMGMEEFLRMARQARTGPDPLDRMAENDPEVNAAYAAEFAIRSVDPAYKRWQFGSLESRPAIADLIALSAGFAAQAVGLLTVHGDRTQDAAFREAMGAEGIAQAILLRCIFGNPFRPVAVEPRWLTPGVIELARTIYEGRAFDRIPQLAEALERAGCTDTDILAHCRGPGPHVRGCWVVDLLLGKE